jgi:hypothetical protein
MPDTMISSLVALTKPLTNEGTVSYRETLVVAHGQLMDE